jgi:mono/diheme cytochrome c family protein
MKRFRNWTLILFAVIGLMAVAGLLVLLAGGISAKPEPNRLEAAVALRLRSLAIPASAKNRANPVPRTPEAIDAAIGHWADHCATCHGTNGDGQTEMGRGLYPRPPDMRSASTQNLTDGALF